MGFFIRSRAPFDRLRAATLLLGRKASSGAFKPIIDEALERIRVWLIREYRGLSRRVWPKISPMTRALSQGREGAAIRSKRQLESAANRAQPLIDTGATLRTLDRGNPMNVFEVRNMGGTVGSRSQILAKHQVAHTTRFVFGPAKVRLLARNVPPASGNVFEDLSRTLSGKKTRWNKLFFILRAGMRNSSGKSYQVPARPLPTEPDRNIVMWFRRAVAAEMARMIRAAHRVGRGE